MLGNYEVKDILVERTRAFYFSEHIKATNNTKIQHTKTVSQCYDRYYRAPAKYLL